MKNLKNKKRLSLDKLSISKLTNPQSVIGGTGAQGGDGTEDRMTHEKKK